MMKMTPKSSSEHEHILAIMMLANVWLTSGMSDWRCRGLGLAWWTLRLKSKYSQEELLIIPAVEFEKRWMAREGPDTYV